MNRMSSSDEPTPGAEAFSQLIYLRVAHGTYSQYASAGAWAPALNAYRLADRIEVCVDLAGVERDSIDVHVSAGRMTIRGHRQSPQPAVPPAHTRSHIPGRPHIRGRKPATRAAELRILTMEIDHGPFCRTLAIPANVDLHRVESEYRDGLLWIRLPLRRSR